MEANANGGDRPKLYLLINNIAKWTNVRDIILMAKQHGVHEVLIGELHLPALDLGM